MPTILLSKADQNYLLKCATELNFTYGLIIGQHAEPDKFIVVHLAKNGEEEVFMHQTDTIELQNSNMDTIENVDTHSIATQWISAVKMIPGSFSVLGLFITSVREDVIEERSFNNARKLLDDLHNLLQLNTNVRATIDDNEVKEYVLLLYSTTARQANCKLYTNLNDTVGVFKPMECRFAEKPFEWITFECNYDMDDNFPILDPSKKLNIEMQFQKSVEAVRLGLQASEILIQNESVDDNMQLDAFVKKKNAQRKTPPNLLTPEHSYKAMIFLPVKCQMSRGNPVKVREFHGAIRFVGAISSRTWCNPRTKMGDVKRFICDDILRSLAARIQVYCDGLTDANVTNEAMFISEPPRRVYFALTTGSTTTNPVQFSEYIFRGEAPTVAVAGAKQILDIDISTDDIIDDLESVPEDDTFNSQSSDDTAIKAAMVRRSPNEITRNMYMLGIAVSLLVLLISVMLHLVTQPQ